MTKPKSPVLSALKHASVSEPLAVAFMEQERWGASPACPLCGSLRVYKMMSTQGGGRNKDYRWRCNDCKKMYTVRTGTIFEETRLPMRVWVYAFWKACSSKKGISALQLAREVEITHKSALFVLRRIRHGLSADRLGAVTPKLSGTVEIDETYVGGKPRYPFKNGIGRGTKKVPVVGMVQRGGDVRFRMMERLTIEKLAGVLVENADMTCRVVTDEFNMYHPLGMMFKGGHETVKHTAREYVRIGTDVHSNTIEGVFSLIKRGVMGTFHSVSRKHLPNYLNEFEFRWNTRKVNDGERVSRAIKQVEGKRLKYRESVDNPPYLPQFKGQADAPFGGGA